MTCFDFDLVEKILLEENRKREIVSVWLYLEGDEHWNSMTIINNKKFVRSRYSHCYGGSFWASPMLGITYLIDNEEFDKTFYVGQTVKNENFDAGCVEKWLNETEIYKKLGMELEEI